MTDRPRQAGRSVTMDVRRISIWSVVRLSMVLYASLYAIVAVAGAILWSAFTATGLRGNVEKFIGALTASGSFHV